MTEFFNDIDRFKQRVSRLKLGIDVDALSKLDFPFFDRRGSYAVVSVPFYSGGLGRSIIVLSKKNSLAFSDTSFESGTKNFKDILNKPYGESTALAFVFFKAVLRNYSQEFERIRSKMNELDLRPALDHIETCGRELRLLTDRFEELVQLIIILKEREVREFDVALIGFDYELLNAETRYWLERCRSHTYRISSLRTKYEMRSNRELNATMRRLTLITTFLTITSIVVSVPGTIGAIFGIPALSDAFFKLHTTMLVWILIGSTLLSIALGYVYWKSLGLRHS